MKHGIYVLSGSGKEMEHIRAARTEAMRGKPHTRRFKNRLYVAHSNRREKACRRAAKKSKKFVRFLVRFLLLRSHIGKQQKERRFPVQGGTK